MAERFIETIPVFRNSLCGATGVAGTIYSDPIDLRDIFRLGITSLSYRRYRRNSRLYFIQLFGLRCL
jgi:hypothetical protein